MRCDESLHGFQVGGCCNSEVAGKRRYELRGHGKAEVRVAGKQSWCSGSGVHCILS
ncbi:hypothetical protein PAXRUDRAFT_835960, partial [Paxillus rubicundulus Ve08.2h10]